MRDWYQLLSNETFLRYAAVGTAGTLLDVGILALLVAVSGIDPATSSLLYVFTSVAFFVAFLNNFILNKLWTFGLREKHNTKRQFFKFALTSLVGLLITNMFMGAFVVLLGVWHIWAKLLTSGIVLVWNFFANKYWTFRTRTLRAKQDREENFAVDLSVVIPAYNEEDRLPQTLRKVTDYLDDLALRYEVLVVDDGSTDGTVDVVNTLCFSEEQSGKIQLIESTKNYGKCRYYRCDGCARALYSLYGC